MSKSTISTFQLFQAIPDQESARQYLESRLWPDGVTCPTCKKGERITVRKATMKHEFHYKDPIDACYAYSEAENEAWVEVYLAWQRGEKYPRWRLIKRDKLLKIWNSFVRTGVVTDYRGIWEMQDIILENVARLEVNTVIVGHTPICPQSIIESTFEDVLTDEQYDTLLDYIPDDAFSDYGLDPLRTHLSDLLTAETCERKLKIIDRVLNVVHCRGDLAKFFVEGGLRTLYELAGDEEREYAWSNQLGRSDITARMAA